MELASKNNSAKNILLSHLESSAYKIEFELLSLIWQSECNFKKNKVQ